MDPVPKQPQTPTPPTASLEWSSTKGWGLRHQDGSGHNSRQKFSLRTLSTHPALEVPGARRTGWPQAHQHPPNLVCSPGAQSTQLGPLLWAELGDMSEGRAEECPQLKVQHPVPLTGNNSGCWVCPARMLSNHVPDSLSSCHSCLDTLDSFYFPSPSPPPCLLQAKSTMSAGATGQKKAAGPTRPQGRQAHDPPSLSSEKLVPCFLFQQDSIIQTRNPHVWLCHFLLQRAPGSRIS